MEFEICHSFLARKAKVYDFHMLPKPNKRTCSLTVMDHFANWLLWNG